MYLTSPMPSDNLHNDDSGGVWCGSKRIRPSCHNALDYLHTSSNCQVVKDTKPIFPGIYMKPIAYDVTVTSGTQPWNNMTTMGNVNTSDMMMIIRWVINISSHCRHQELLVPVPVPKLITMSYANHKNVPLYTVETFRSLSPKYL